jgi:hypothetical protein
MTITLLQPGEGRGVSRQLGERTVIKGDSAGTRGAYALRENEAPRGTVHTLANRGTSPVRWLTLLSPAWISGWIEEETSGNQAEVFARYGLEIVGPPPPAGQG